MCKNLILVKYKIYSHGLTWNQAKVVCESLGGALATIKNVLDGELIEKMVKTMNAPNNYWIGLREFEPEVSFRWIDGSPLTYTNWNAGEPNFDAAENCAFLRKDTLQWSISSCRWKIAYFICEW